MVQYIAVPSGACVVLSVFRFVFYIQFVGEISLIKSLRMIMKNSGLRFSVCDLMYTSNSPE